jgi:hypothetical protein
MFRLIKNKGQKIAKALSNYGHLFFQLLLILQLLHPTSIHSFVMMGSPMSNPFMASMVGNPYMTSPGQAGQFGMQGGGMNGTVLPMAAMVGMQSINNTIDNVVKQSNTVAQMTAAAEAARSLGNTTTIQDGYFPQCTMMPAQAGQLSESACANNTISNQGDQMVSYNIMALADKRAKEYEASSMKGKQLGNSTGIQCFKEQSQLFLDQLKRQRESLKAIMDEFAQANAQFTAGSEGDMESLRTLNRELAGTKQGGVLTAEDRKRDFAKLIGDSQCSMVLDPATQLSSQEAMAKGLYGIKDSLQASLGPVRDARSQLQSANYEKLLEQDLKRLERKDKTDVASVSGLNFPFVNDLFDEEKNVQGSHYRQLKANIEKATKGLVKLPDDIKSYERGLEAGNLPSEKYIKDTIKKSCLRNPNQSVSLERIADKLEQIGPDGRPVPSHLSTSLKTFKDRLNNIFENDNYSSEQMIREVQKLEKSMGGTNFTARISSINQKQSATSSGKSYNVSAILVENDKYCDTWYENQSFVGGSSKSIADTVRGEMTKLSKMKNTINSSNSDIKSIIKKRIMNCEGVAKFDPSPKSCNASYFDIGSNKNFCLKNAQTCVKAFEDCSQKIQAVISNREGKLKDAAKNFNVQANAFLKKQDKGLKDKMRELRDYADRVSKYFPGIPITIPEGLFIPPQKEVTTTHGVPVVGDGNLNFLNVSVTKLQEAYRALEAQETTLKNDVFAKREQELTETYNKSQQYWKGLSQKCMTANQSYAQAVKQQNDAAAKAHNQRLDQMQRMCSMMQYATMGPGCNGTAQGLVTQMGQVTGQMGMGPEAWKLGQMVQTCNFMNNTQQTLSQNPILQSAASGNIDLISMCAASGSEGAAEQFNFFLVGNGWQVASVLSTHHGVGISGEDLKNCIANARVEGDSVNCAGLNSEQLKQTNNGRYVETLMRVNAYIKGNTDTNNTSSNQSQTKNKEGETKSNQGICEYIRFMTDLVMKNEEVNRICGATTSQTTFGGAPVPGNSGLETCYNAQVKLRLRASLKCADVEKIDTSGKTKCDETDLAKKQEMYLKVGERITQLAQLQNSLQGEAGIYMTRAMGQTPNMGCAAAYNSPRMPEGGSGPFQFGNLGSAGRAF